MPITLSAPASAPPRTVAEKPPSWWVFFAIVALPALLLGRLISKYGVDVPYYDDWQGLAPMFKHWHEGTFGLADFFALNNEHRLAIPRLIFLPLALLTKWNGRAEMFATLSVLVLVTAVFWRLLLATGWKASRGTYVLFAGIAVLVLNLLQFENLLWGFTFHFVLPILFMVAGILAATRLPAPRNLLVTAILCTCATYSIASGFTCWLLVAPLLMMPKGRALEHSMRKWSLAWVALFAVSFGCYFIGYVLPEHHGDEMSRTSAAQLVHYWFAYIGAPFAPLGAPFAPGAGYLAIQIATIVGIGITATFTSILAALWRWRADRPFIERALPWVMVASIGFINATIVTAGRGGLGVPQAMSPRYIAYSVMAAIGLLPLVPIVIRQWAAHRPAATAHRCVRVLAGLAALILAALHLMADYDALPYWADFCHYRRTTKAVLTTMNVVDEPKVFAKWVWLKPSDVPPLADAMDKAGYLRPPLLRSPDLDKIASTSPAPGTMEFIGTSPENALCFSGWAVMPDSSRIADAVFVSCDDAQNRPILISVAAAFRPSREGLIATQNPALTACGWTAVIPPQKFGANPGTIRAWAYDAELCRAYPLAKGVIASPSAKR